MENKKLDFTWVGVDSKKSEEVGLKSTSFWKDAFRRLFKSKTSIVVIVVLLVIIGLAIFVPIFSEFTIMEMNPAENYLKWFSSDSLGKFHILGTDKFGRDVWVRIWDGARVSLIIAFAAVVVDFVLGAVYGGLAGFFGGIIDNIMMRIVEVLVGIPYMIIIILLMMVMKRGIGTIIVAYALVGWTDMARLVRGQVLQLKEQEFVMAAKVMGGSPVRIIARHLLPNTLSVMIVNLTLAVPGAIFTEAFLSFIGLGVPIPYSSWGILASEGVVVYMFEPQMLLAPAFLISITMLSFNLLGDALRDAFDPKLRR